MSFLLKKCMGNSLVERVVLISRRCWSQNKKNRTPAAQKEDTMNGEFHVNSVPPKLMAMIPRTKAGKLNAAPSQSMFFNALTAGMSSGRGRKLGVKARRIGVETAPMMRLI